MTDPANQEYQYSGPSRAPIPISHKRPQSGSDGHPAPEPFYPTIPPPPEAPTAPEVYQPQPDFSNLPGPTFSSEPMLQVGNADMMYPGAHSSASLQHQTPFRPVPQDSRESESVTSESRLWKAPQPNIPKDEMGNSDAAASNARISSEPEPSTKSEGLPIARAQQKGQTYIPRVDRQHIGEAEHEQYKSKYAAEVRGLRSRIDDLWGGSAWFTQQIVPGYGRAGSHDRVLYTIQQLARGSPGEGGEGGTYPERVRQAIEDAVHARLEEENKNRKSKRENLNLRAVVTTNDFKAAAKALGCVALRMPAGQPRKPRQPRQGSKAAAASTSKAPNTKADSNNSGSNRSISPGQSQISGGEASNWMQPVALNSVGNDLSASHHSHSPHPLPNDYPSCPPQVAPPSLPASDDEVRANRAAFFAKYEADRVRRTPSFSDAGLQTQGSLPSGSSNHSAASSRQHFATLNAPQFGNSFYHGHPNPWMTGTRDSNERWNGNQLSNPQTPQFNHSPSDRDSAYHSAPLTRRPSLDMDGSQVGRESYQPSPANGGMRPPSPSIFGHPMNGITHPSQNQSHIMRSVASPSMAHPPTSLASHSLSQMSSPQMRNMNPGEAPNSNGRALPTLPSLSLPPMHNGGNSLPPLNWSHHHQQQQQQQQHQPQQPQQQQRKRASEEGCPTDESRDLKRRAGNQFHPATAPAESVHYA